MDGSPFDQKRARMVDGPVNSPCRSGTPNFPQRNSKNGVAIPDFLKSVPAHKHNTLNLEKPAGAKLKIVDLHDPNYSRKYDKLDEWGTFYLPERVSMQVVGVLEGTPYPCDEPVLMKCEDGKVYVYDREELHLVASSMEQVLDKGIDYPASKSYYDGEAFKDMTKKDWDKVKEGTVGKSLDRAHHKLVMARKSRLLENLKSTRHHTGFAC